MLNQLVIPTSRSYKLARVGALALCSSLLVLAAGCKKSVDDSTLNTNVHAALTGDTAIAQEPIQSSVTNGVVTLSGNVSSDTARLVASQDAAKVSGVKEVVDSLTVQGVDVTPTITSAAAPSEPRPATVQEQQQIATTHTLPAPSSESAPPPPPAYHDLTVSAGDGISVRITQTLSSTNAQDGQPFSGVVTQPVVVHGEVAIPAGSGVSGTVTDAKSAGHYKGNSFLSVALTGINRHGEHIRISTDTYTLEGKGRGKNTAEKIGGGAAVGAILGGIFGGGKGAAIGAAAGGGGGAVLNGVTRGQEVEIPSESVVRFHLSSSFTVRSEGPVQERYSGLQTH
jgi:hypothetical protein